MNLLMSVAVLGTLGIGAWDEAATVSFLFSVAELKRLDRALSLQAPLAKSLASD